MLLAAVSLKAEKRLSKTLLNCFLNSFSNIIKLIFDKLLKTTMDLLVMSDLGIQQLFRFKHHVKISQLE